MLPLILWSSILLSCHARNTIDLGEYPSEPSGQLAACYCRATSILILHYSIKLGTNFIHPHLPLPLLEAHINSIYVRQLFFRTVQENSVWVIQTGIINDGKHGRSCVELGKY